MSTSPPPGEQGHATADEPDTAVPAPSRRMARLGPRSRRRPLALTALGVLLAASGLVAVGGGSGAPAARALTLVPPTAAAPTTTITTAPVELPAPVPSTAPEPPPPPRAPTPIVAVGEMRVPKIGLVHTIYEGVTLTVVDRGPGHWPGSAMPGQLGNAVFAGHRTTHSQPFRHLDRLAAGDEIHFSTDAGEFTYRVTGTEIVGPRDTWIVTPTPDATLTLFACHPPGSARQRIVVRAAYAGASSQLS